MCLLFDALFLSPALFTGASRAPWDLVVRDPPLVQENPDLVREPHNPLLSDWARQFLPWSRQVRTAWLDGRLPFWNELAGGGAPLAGNLQSEAFSPYLPLNLAGGKQYWDLKALGQMLVAQVLSLLLVRHLGGSALAGLVTALAFSLCSYLQSWFVHPHAGVAAFTPGLFLAFAALLGVRRGRAVAWGALAVGAAVAAGHPGTAFRAVLAAGLFAALYTEADQRWRSGRAAQLAGLAATLLLGLALASVVVAPFADYLSESSEVNARLAAHGELRDAIGSSAHLFTLLDPDALGPRNAHRAYRGERNFLETGFFAGRVVLLLALVGAAAGVLRERRIALPLIVLSAVGFVGAYEGPGLSKLLAHVPGFDQIRLRRTTQISALPIALLAGLGFDALRAAGIRHKSLPAAGVAGLALAVCLAPWLLLHPLGLAEHAARPDVGIASYVVLALAGVVATLLAVPHLPGTARGVLMALLVVGVAAEGAWVWRDFVPTATSSQTRPRSPLLEAIARDGGGRLLALGRSVPPEIPSLFGAPALRSYDAIGLARLRDLKLRIGAFRMPESAQITRGLPAPLLDLLGVRFVLADANAVNLRLPEIGPGAARPALELEKLAPGVVVLRRPTSLPVAYRASAWTTVANEKRALSAVLAPSFDPHRQTVIESTAEWDTAQSPGPGDRIEPLAVTRARPESLRVALPDRRGGLVVVTESYARGWRAYADGEEVPVMAANAFARAAFAPKGTRVLEFVYRPRGFRLALSVTGLAVLGILGLFARDLRRARET